MKKLMLLILFFVSPLFGISVENGATDVTVYFNLHDTDGTMLTGETVTTFDLYYVEDGAAISAKADATALAAADTAHTDNYAYEIGQGIYRVDFPDAAFDGGVGKRVQLVLVYDTSYNAVIEVELSPPVNAVMISGDATAADNAELFYDGTGYNAANSTIGTVTTNTDLVTAEAVVNEWETQSQSDPTGFHVNVLEIGGTAQTANDNGADINAILTDTGELQTNQGDWATATSVTVSDKTGFSLSAAGIDAVWDEATAGHVSAGTTGKALTDALADTDELQTNQGNWVTATGFATAVNLATVDGIVDTILLDTDELQTNQGNWATATGFATSGALATVDGIVDAILLDTGELQTNQGDWVTATGFATSANIATALTDIHLDHLLAVEYDPASKPGVATALFNELIESDSGVSRFTENSLEQAPGGGSGGDATLANQTTIIGLINALGSLGDGSVSVDHDYGGSDELTYKTAGGAGIDNAIVRAYLTADYDAGNKGSAYIKGTTTTDVNGEWTASLLLDPEDYTIEFSKQGIYGPDTSEITVTAP